MDFRTINTRKSLDYDYEAAHRFCSNHMAELKMDTKCGCFFCLEIFHPNQIKGWLQDHSGTAVCPYCGIDSVIGESSGFPITKEFLSAMQAYWFWPSDRGKANSKDILDRNK